MSPLIWGTLLHDLLLFIASAYPDKPSEERQKSMLLFIIHCFANVPCQEPCAMEASKYAHDHAPDVSSRKALLEYFVTFHNWINEKNGKKSDWNALTAVSAAHARHGSSIRSLARADQVRVEDHKMMQEIIKENNQLREQLGLPWRRENEYFAGENWEKQKLDFDFNKYFQPYNGPESKFDISIMLIVVVSLIVFFVFVMAFVGK